MMLFAFMALVYISVKIKNHTEGYFLLLEFFNITEKPLILPNCGYLKSLFLNETLLPRQSLVNISVSLIIKLISYETSTGRVRLIRIVMSATFSFELGEISIYIFSSNSNIRTNFELEITSI